MKKPFYFELQNDTPKTRYDLFIVDGLWYFVIRNRLIWTHNNILLLDRYQPLVT